MARVRFRVRLNLWDSVRVRVRNMVRVGLILWVSVRDRFSVRVRLGLGYG